MRTSHDPLAARAERRPGQKGRRDPAPAVLARAGLTRSPHLLGPGAVLGLQRLVGNAAVAQLLGTQAEKGERSPVKEVVGRGGGQPLDGRTRSMMESSLGHDFSDVRIHTGPRAAASARSVGASAYTVGTDVVLAGAYDPASPATQRTLAHELTHVVQQRSGPVDGAPAPGGIRVSQPSDPFEREAERSADAVMSGDPSMATISPGQSIQRSDCGAPTVQRWAIQNPNFNTTRSIETITTGRPVFFFEDNTGDRMVVKASVQDVGIHQLAEGIHKSMGKNSSIVTTDVTPSRQTISAQIGNPNLTTHRSWAQFGATKLAQNAAGITEADKARNHQLALVGGIAHLVAMTLAHGDSFEEITEVQRPTDPVTGQNINTNRRSRQLLETPSHMRNLGLMTAVDLFVNNADRILSSNFGNWLVDVSGKINLIDNADDHVQRIMQSQLDFAQVNRELAGFDPNNAQHQIGQDIGVNDTLPLLASKVLNRTSTQMVFNLLDRAYKDGDQDIGTWAGAVVKGGRSRHDIMLAAFERGLREGRARIIKTYATRRWMMSGLKARRAARAAAAVDTRPTRDDYWNILKGRADWLRKN